MYIGFSSYKKWKDRDDIENIVGKGSAEPVADNGTAQGRQLNRRVEIYLYASQAMVDAANAGTLK